MPAKRAALVLAAAACLPGCGPSHHTKKTLNAHLAAQDFPSAEAYLQTVKDSEYTRKNQVLYYLDLGLIQHHAGKFKESDASFEKAENRMIELYTKSATKAAGTMLLNDMTMDYGGEAYERALTNVFRALNFVFLGLPDEALVESRKVEAYLDELSRGKNSRRAYKDDAFARYLDHLLYLDADKQDDARISLEAAEAAYGWYAKTYNTPKPAFDLPSDPEAGELVFIHYNGVAPRKISKTFQVAWNEAALAVNALKAKNDPEANSAQFKNALAAGITGKAITVAFPEYVQDPYLIAGSEVRVGEASAPTRIMEDISAIAHKDLADRLAAIRARALARAMIKYIIAQAATKAAEDKYGKNSGMAIFTKITANVGAAATEIADTRGWTTLPSQIRLARLRLPPGAHEVSVEFQNAAGHPVLTERFKGVRIQKGRRTYLSFRTAR